MQCTIVALYYCITSLPVYPNTVHGHCTTVVMDTSNNVYCIATLMECTVQCIALCTFESQQTTPNAPHLPCLTLLLARCSRHCVFSRELRMGVLYNVNFQHLEMTWFFCQQNAWMDEEAMLVWVDKVLQPYIKDAPAGIFPICFWTHTAVTWWHP